MRMRPISRRTGFIEHPCGEDTILLEAEGDAHRLDPLAMAVWRSADGEHDLDALLAVARTARPDADRTLLFEVLDRLADGGLLEARPGPPAGLSRRVLVQQLVGATAAAALGTLLGTPTAEAADCGETDAVVAALKRLTGEQEAVAGELESMVEAALDVEEPDPAEVEALSVKTAEVHVAAAEEEEAVARAEIDAAECRAPGDAGARKKRRETLHRRRQEKHTKRTAAHAERHRKRMKALGTHEKQAKARLGATERREKRGASQESRQKSRGRHEERSAKLKQRHELRRRSQEEHHKRTKSHVDKHHKTASERLLKAKNKPLKPLFSAEEGAKATAEDAKRAEAVKKAGGAKEHAKRIAREAKQKASHKAKLKKKMQESRTKRIR